MRLLTSFDKPKTAQDFAEILDAAAVEYQVSGVTSALEFWIIDEEQVQVSRDLLARFLANPDDPVLQTMQKAQKNSSPDVKSLDDFKKRMEEKKKQEEEAQRRKLKANAVRHREVFSRSDVFGQRSLSWIDLRVNVSVIAICVLLYLLPFFGEGMELLTREWLYFINLNNGFAGNLNDIISRESSWTDSPWTGAIWRFVTPALLHGGIFHLIFNMFYTWTFGMRMEPLLGVRKTLLFILGCAAFSNTPQYLIVGPNFVGYSGVIFGYAGYLWTRSHYDYRSRFLFQTSEIVVLLIWMGVGILGLLGNIANIVHAGGLVFGMAVGLLSGDGAKRLLKQDRSKYDRIYLAILFLSLPIACFFDWLFISRG